MGAQPGISNLMVRYALDSLDTATSVEIFDGWRDITESDSPMYFTWSPQTFFDESSLEAIIFKNGKYETRPAFSEPQKVKFPSPVGEVDVFLSLHSELATIPHSFASYGVKNLVWKEDQTFRRHRTHFQSKNFRRRNRNCSAQVFLETAGIEEFGKDSRGCRTQ